jgi:hypothetical protein
MHGFVENGRDGAGAHTDPTAQDSWAGGAPRPHSRTPLPHDGAATTVLGVAAQSPPVAKDGLTCARPGQPLPPLMSTHVLGGRVTGGPHGPTPQPPPEYSDMVTEPHVTGLGDPHAQEHWAGGALRSPNPS